MKKPLLLMAFVACSMASFAQIDVASFGSAISAKEGTDWMQNYKTKFGQTDAICYGANSLRTLLDQPGVEGIYILRGLDESQREVLLFKAADKNGILMNNGITIGKGLHRPTQGIADAGSVVEDKVAGEMISRFQQSFKGRTPIYLYGTKGFETILNLPGAEGIRFVNGLDEKGEEHLIFTGADKKGESMMNATIWNHGSGIFYIISLFARR